MSPTSTFGYILVYSTSQALRIEKLLQQTQLGCKLVPVPRHLSSDCGVCVRIELEDLVKARQIISQANIHPIDIVPG